MRSSWLHHISPHRYRSRYPHLHPTRPPSIPSPPCSLFSCSTAASQKQPPPAPPNLTTSSSTSALEYKLSHLKRRPPPLPSIDPPSWSTEQAVTNILYNTPPPSNQPIKRHVLNCLVQNEPGVLSRISGILASRGFNIESLVVCATEIPELSRMCIVLKSQAAGVEQAKRQLEDVVPVWAVLDYTHNKTIERELLLVKVSILGPEYFEDQIHAKSGLATPSLSDDLHESDPDPSSYSSTATQLSPSEALRQKHFHLQALTELANHFSGRVVDVSHDSVIIELSAKTCRVDAFLKLVRPYGILEAARTGLMVMPRSPIESEWVGMSDTRAVQEEETVDAGLLPPG